MPSVATTAGLSRPYCFRSLRSSGRSFRAVICADCSCPSRPLTLTKSAGACTGFTSFHSSPVFSRRIVCAADASSSDVTFVWSNAERRLVAEIERRFVEGRLERRVDEKYAIARRQLGVDAGAGRGFLAEENALRLFLALDVERHIDARLGEAVRLQVGGVLVDDPLFFEVRRDS